VTVVALCSAKGSPGVTTLACVLGAVWPVGRPVVVAEWDPSGGDLALRFGLYARRGMTSLVLARRQESSAGDASLVPHTQSLPGGLEVLVGPVGADSATALDHELAKVSGPVFPADNALVDCGRVIPGAPGQRRMLAQADRVLVVSRSDASGLGHARWALDRIRALDRTGITSLILVGEGQFGVRDASSALGIEVLEAVPDDPSAAAVACGAPGKAREFARSRLVASARRIVDRILCEVSSRTADVGTLTDVRDTGEDTQVVSEVSAR
jgi:MinD-like ATPase involved in chromosome partitioning or flagellar assembly